MQLQNTPIPPKAIPVARETLGISDMVRGNQAMTQPNAGMYNSDDGGAMSKPYINAQPTENQALAMQNLRANANTAAPQANVGAVGAVRKANTEQETAGYRAQEMLNERMAAELQMRGGGQALMQINSIMQSPDREAFINDVATSKAMFAEQAPELGSYIAEANRYGQ